MFAPIVISIVMIIIIIVIVIVIVIIFRSHSGSKSPGAPGPWHLDRGTSLVQTQRPGISLVRAPRRDGRAASLATAVEAAVVGAVARGVRGGRVEEV